MAHMRASTVTPNVIRALALYPNECIFVFFFFFFNLNKLRSNILGNNLITAINQTQSLSLSLSLVSLSVFKVGDLKIFLRRIEDFLNLKSQLQHVLLTLLFLYLPTVRVDYNFNSLGWARQLLKKTVVLLYEPQPTMILFLDDICFLY